MSHLASILEIATQCACPDAAALEQVLKNAVGRQVSPVVAAVDSGLVDEYIFLKQLSLWLDLPWLDEPIPEASLENCSQFPARVALRHQIYPLSRNGETWDLLTGDPFDYRAKQAVYREIPDKVRWCMAPRKRILQALRDGYGIGADTFDELIEKWDLDFGATLIQQETTVVDADDSEATVVNFVNQIIREALEQEATDIHFEPLHDDLRVRFRVDGVLHEAPVPQRLKLLQASVISRLKIMAHLDIAEHRLPQDGRINLEYEGRTIDVRVATVPSVEGESVSLRLLGQERFTLARLGLDGRNENIIRELLAMPNGILLVTGPTGCGKSTSLYTFLTQLNTAERRIVTIEDPVENKIPGVVQIAVKPEINLTFASALRSVLRSDPNVVMVGEMRDYETAEIAIRSALTGHLVFSTLHTNDALGGVTRLLDMGVEPYLIASSVRAFIAQRLVRRLCPHCLVPAEYPAALLGKIGFPSTKVSSLRKSAGCEKCKGSGFRGRLAIYEIFRLTPRIQEMITERKPAGDIAHAAAAEGMINLRQYGFQKAVEGVTSLDEVLRVTLENAASE